MKRVFLLTMFSTLTYCYSLVVNTYLVGHVACGDCIAVLAQFNHIAHWILSINVILLIVALIIGVWEPLMLLLLPGTMAFVIWYGGNFLPRSVPPVEGTLVSVSTFNIQGIHADHEQIIETIRSLDSDLIGLQELTPSAVELIDEQLSEEYPYRATHLPWTTDGLALLSRYPILEVEQFAQDSDGVAGTPFVYYLRAVVNVTDTPVIVYVFHPFTPNFEPFTQYNDNALQYQTRLITTHLLNETDPTLMPCDCNATPQSQQYLLLDKLLGNAAGVLVRPFLLVSP